MFTVQKFAQHWLLVTGVR